MKTLRGAICLALTLLSYPVAHGAIMFDPSLKWRSIKTEHFRIHYHQGLEAEAARLAVKSEELHRELAPLHRWTPFFRTDVVMVDSTDDANGFSTPYPFNRVQLYIARPRPDSSLSNYDDWQRLLFTHEYTHTLNLDAISGIPSITRYTLGRVCFPNVFLPMWMLEGNAVYHESRRRPGSPLAPGRNNSTYTDMVMRAAIAENRFMSISDSSHFPREWPMGSTPYLYGGLFVDFLEKKYGRNSFSLVMEENTDNIIPYLVNRNAKDVYDESLIPLWREWERYLEVRFRRQLDSIEAAGVTPVRLLTGSGYLTSHPRFSRDGAFVYYVRSTAHRKTALMRGSIGTGKIEELCEVHDPGSISVTDGPVYLSDPEYHRSFSLYNDAFVFDGKTYRRVTKALRGDYLDLSPDGSVSVFVRQERGRCSLVFSDRSFIERERIVSESDIQIACTRLSPDGSRVVFTMKDRNGNSDLALYHRDRREFTRLTSDRFNDICPTWHPDGRRVIFSSDRDGVYNLYEMDTVAGTVSRLSNLAGGAFHPDISPDGLTIAFAAYGARGFDIALIPYPSTGADKTASPPTTMKPDYFNAPYNDETPTPPGSPYTPVHSVMPPFWLPIFGTSELYEDKYDQLYGIFLPGNDTLYRHFYSLSAYVYNIQRRAVVDLNYLYAGFYPNLLFRYENEALFYGEDRFPWSDDLAYGVKRTLERAVSGGIEIPFIRFLYAHSLMLSYRYEEEITDVSAPLGGGIDRARDRLAGVGAAWIFTGAREYPYSISEEDGMNFALVADMYNEAIGSDLSFSKVRAELSRYLGGLARNNVLMIRLRGGASFNNPARLSPYPLGRFERGKSGPPASDEDEFGLRGYPAGAEYSDRFSSGTLEYRFPLLQREGGFRMVPLYFRDLSARVFFEYGNAWNGKAEIREFRPSAGAETHIRITAGYMMDARAFIGYARGFGRLGEDQVYFGVYGFFEGAFKNIYRRFSYL
jgi:Tol biopolymer transport system component